MKKITHYLIITILAMISGQAMAQVGVGITTPDASAQLDITATGKGLLVPRMTTANRPTSPATGLIIYQTDGTAGFYYYDGSTWKMISNTTSAASAFNDTLTRNLYTSSYLLSADGTTGIKMYSNGLIADTGTYGSGTNLRVSGAGTRMIWYPKAGAFRAGTVAGSNWDSSNIGNYSTAFGYDNKVSGNASFAAGEQCTVGASDAFVAGYQSSASQAGGVAIGIQNSSSGASGTAIGRGNNASAYCATALGNFNAASGNSSVALGVSSTASGDYSRAIGYSATSSGSYSTAIGRSVSTNNKAGSFILGDSSSSTTSNDAYNQMMMRFAGGYKLYTNDAATQGVQLNTSGVLDYMNNVSGSYDSRSLTDKNYVDSSISARVSSASFNDTLTRNLYTNSYKLTADGTTGVTLAANGVTTIGYNNAASTNGSTAIGYSNWANNMSTSLGDSSSANSTKSIAIGDNAIANSAQSIAIGNHVTASGTASMAFGNYVNNSSRDGSVIIGDNSTTTATTNDASNQMTMRFNGGYKLYTNSTATQGVKLNTSGVLEYMNNVSGSYDSRSLTDKNYVDSISSARATAATFNDTLTRNLYTSGYLVTADGTTGMKMYNNGLMVDTGTLGSGSSLTVSGAGTRMFWYPQKAAFRAGALDGTQWDDANIGSNSVAFGWDNTASGSQAAGFGQHNTVSGNQAFGAGWYNDVSGMSAASFGVYNTSSGTGSVVLGYSSTSTGLASAAIGFGATASGDYSFACNSATASGTGSVAMGNSYATGNNSVAIGQNLNTNGKDGSFILGDTSTTATYNDAYNQMMMRFSGGYKLYTNSAATQGVALNTSGVLKYMNNVSGSYDSRSLTDKNYVDSSISARISSFNDTLTRNLYTNGYKITPDGTTGLLLSSTGGTSIGTACVATGSSSFAAGGVDTATATGAIAIGIGSTSSNTSSIALGYKDTASGQYSVAIGNNNKASANGSFVAGANSEAINNQSISLGNNNVSSGNGSFTAGTNNQASGWGSSAIGIYLTASNTGAVAMGSSNTASGQYSLAVGHQAIASGNNSVAMGYSVSTNGQSGSFIFGDTSVTGYTNNDTTNQMMMRFAGGYKLYTDGAATQGVALNTNGVLEYMNNVSGNYDSRSLTDKNYVDSVVSAHITATFNDTLTNNLYTNSYKLTADGTTGITLAATGVTTIGYNNTAGSNGSTAIGYSNWANFMSTSIGDSSSANSSKSIAIGDNATANASQSIAIGNHVTTAGTGGMALGNYVNSSSHGGCFIIGDNSTTTVTTNDAANEMMMRFAGGYKLYTNSAATQGIKLNTSGVLEYMNNVSSSYDSRSLTDKNYVDSVSKTGFNDTLTHNLYTSGYKVTPDGTTGLLVSSGGATAFGSSSYASGAQSVAGGDLDTASGAQSVAMGYLNKATGGNSAAFGSSNTATASGSFVAGTSCNSTANGSIAIGLFNTASNTGAVSLGSVNTASGLYSLTAGNLNTASGNNSVAIGTRVSTNSKAGSFIFGDSSASGTTNDASNQMMMRFTGGYKLYSNSGLTAGLQLTTTGGSNLGISNIVSGTDATGIGNTNTASNTNAVAIGNNNTASSTSAVALGNNLTASGASSVAIGSYVSTNSLGGSLIMGDNSTTTATTNDAANQMMMRFAGGYKLYTNSAATQGIALNTSGVLEYMNNVSGSYDSRSLTDKNYVDSISKTNFNDTLTRNLYTNGYMITRDGSTGLSLSSNGGTASGSLSYTSANYATAMGFKDTASGVEAVAMGNVNKATNNAAIAMGSGNTASGNAAVAIGSNNVASSTLSYAIGNTNTASAISAVALGNNLTASGASSVAIGSYVSTNSLGGSLIMGDNSTTTATTIDAANQMKARFTGGYKLFSNAALTAGLQLTSSGGSNLGISNTVSGTNAAGIGNTVTASATNAIAIGTNTTASGASSVAIGSYVSTNSKAGSVIIGDSSTTTATNNSTTNQMVMRFANGYKLFTNSAASVGTQVAAGGNSWSTISDRRKKENFAPVNGEALLSKISKMPLSSWNYKGQDAKIFRHYGPMAQDFFAAFGKDSYGTSGNDTTINQADMEGVTFIAVQALEKRTQELQKENTELKSELEKMKADYAARLERLEAAMKNQNAPRSIAPVK